MESERRTLYRHGALLLLVGALLGLMVAAPVPHQEKWMAAHVAGLLTGILLFAIGGLWPELRLSPKTRRLAMQMGLVAAWGGFAGQIYGAIVDLPGPATEPGRAPDHAWQGIVFGAAMVVVVPATLASFFLVWRGLKK